MKRLDRLVIKSFVGPLLLTFAVAVFVLLMQFIWKYVDDIAGKGLSVWVILKLMVDASATFVPMALPIAVLFASIMTMGNMGEHYELVAVKSGGVPLWRAMVPMGAIVVVLTVVAFLFANYVMPSAVLKYRTTLYDITRKKPALNIKPGEYYSEIDGFVIRVDKKEADGKTLQGITIYDEKSNVSRPDVVVAKKGYMQTTDNELLFTLYDGCSYSETDNNGKASNPFTRVYFAQNVISFDLSDFAYNKSDESIFQGGYQMMNISQLDSNVVRLREQMESNAVLQTPNIRLDVAGVASSGDSAGLTLSIYDLLDSLDDHQAEAVRREACEKAERRMNDTRVYSETYYVQSEYVNRHFIEWHRKFTLSVACLVLFFVGAPFGSIVRKGGLGLPLVASVVFFVLYYVIGMIAEKAVREGAIDSWGMWISTLIMIPVGIILTYKAVQR